MSHKFKIGSHDTMTYLKPAAWFLRPFHFVAKCQNLSIEDQYKAGCKMFDIRLKYNKKTRDWDFAHGCMRFKGDSYDRVLSWLNDAAVNEKIYVRMVLEYNRPIKDIDSITQLFAITCSQLRHQYKNLIFFGFNRKYDWKECYSYEGMPYPDIYQATSSMTWKIWDDWFPWLYAKSHNKDNLEQGTSHDWLSLDFIQ